MSSLSLVIGFFLTACETIEPGPLKKQPLDNSNDSITNKVLGKGVSGVKEKDHETKGGQQQNSSPINQVEIYQGSGLMVDKSNHLNNRAQAEGKYILNFENAELIEVIRVVLNDTLNKNYVLDPRVIGKVSLRTIKPLTEESLLSTLEMVLQLNNAVLVKSGNSYQIQLATTAIPSSSSPKLSGSSLSPGFQIRIIPLSFVGAKQMVDILKPLLAPTALLKTDVVRNLIMVTGTSEQLENIEETVNIFDVDTLQGLSFGLFHLNYVDPETINKELSEIFGSSEGGPLEEMFKILPIERLNAILVITPQPKYIEQLKTWLTRLDRSKTGVSGSVHVYRVQHIKAVELAATLNDIFNQTGTMTRSKSASLAPGSKSTTLSNKTDTATTSNTPSSNSSLSNTNKRGNITGIGEVRITADEVNNTLITVATTPDYKIVREVITELDVMPLQVHIDASILSVNLDDSIKYGVKWTFDNIPNGEYSGIADLALSTPTSGFSYLISKSSNVKASIDALAERKNISVISSPSLMVLNNQEARIQVGDKVPIRTSQSTNTNSGSANPIQTSSIEMLETGVTLKVTPRVNSGGVVIMDIEQSVDTPSKTQTSSIDSPSVLKRSINSSVVVDSEETVVLGGLISDNIEDSKSGIPLLMDLPWVGDLFSSTSRQKTRNELIVLITPRVVQNQTDARAVTRDYKKQLTGIYNVLPKLKDK